MLQTLRAFWQDQRGMALILVAILLPVIIGFSLLVIDMSRANTLHNDLQKAADAFALAAAAELDRSTGSWARAERAMATLVRNERYFTEDEKTLTAGEPGGNKTCNSAGSIQWCFLQNIPPSDATAISSAYYASNDPLVGEKQTQYIQVTVKPTGFRTIFPASFLTGSAASNSFTVGAQAVAGFTSSVCDYTPVFICNPYENTSATSGVTLEQAAQTRQYRRRQILLRGDSSYAPGNFAFLQSPFGNGANALAQMLASSKPQNCYSRTGVDTEPGQNAGPVQDGLNTRFGINTGFTGAGYGPAVNVRKGAKNGNKCVASNKVNYETDPNKGIGLERDTCQTAGNCTMMGGRMGAGDWNFARYWSVNHPKRAVPPELSGTGANLPTRYEVYRYEIDNNVYQDTAVGGETGIPACGTPVTTVDRRLLYGAILDCQALQASGFKFTGRATGVPVKAFASFFVTEPIKDGKDIFAELVDITGKGGRGTLDNFLRDEAQLYR
jgi:Flp pilus assembly protein TadG